MANYVCVRCGAGVERMPSRVSGKVFCGNVCRGKWWGERLDSALTDNARLAAENAELQLMNAGTTADWERMSAALAQTHAFILQQWGEDALRLAKRAIKEPGA